MSHLLDIIRAMRGVELEEQVTRLAAAQHGLCARHQLAAAGASTDAIKRLVRTRRLEPLSRNVFRTPGAPESWHQRLMAAQLDAGPEAFVSHRSAAALHRLPGFVPEPVEVTKVRGWHHRTQLGILHETAWLSPDQVRVIEGLRCSSLARCVFELAGSSLHPERVARTLDNALSRHGLTISAVAETTVMLGRRGRPGTALMRRLVDERSPGFIPPESELEALFIAVCDAHGLAQPRRQVSLGDEQLIGRVDFLYDDARVIVECHGKAYHGSLLDWEHDLARQARLEAAGFRPVIVTWRQLVTEPELVVTRVRQALRPAVTLARA